jgi:hypothetical protein
MKCASKMAWIMHPGNTIVSTLERKVAFSLEGISDGGAEKHNKMTHA